jgi:hypothetical protein
MVESVNGVFDMPDTNDPIWRVIGKLEGSLERVESLLEEGNAQRKEFQGDIRTAVTEIQTFIPMITRSHDWIEGEGKPAVNGMKRAKHIAIGAMGVSAVGSSPAWVGKVAAFFQAIVP